MGINDLRLLESRYSMSYPSNDHPHDKQQREKDIFDIVKTVSDEKALQSETSPQSKAFHWIVDDDPLRVDPSDDITDDSKILQRYVVAVIYFSMDGDDWFCGSAGDDWEDDCLNKDDQGSVPYLSGSDECTWYGNFCNDELFIIEIHLDDNNLSGKIPLEITSLGPQYRVIDMDGNKNIHGPLPSTISALTNLAIIDLDDN